MKTLATSFRLLLEKVTFLPTTKDRQNLQTVYSMYMVELRDKIKELELEVKELENKATTARQSYYKVYYNE